jgi:hypothetical protein
MNWRRWPFSKVMWSSKLIVGDGYNEGTAAMNCAKKVWLGDYERISNYHIRPTKDGRFECRVRVKIKY